MSTDTLIIAALAVALAWGALCFTLGGWLASRSGQARYDEGYADAENIGKMHARKLWDLVRHYRDGRPLPPWEAPERPVLAPRHAPAEPRRRPASAVAAGPMPVLPSPRPWVGKLDPLSLLGSVPTAVSLTPLLAPQPSGVSAEQDTGLWKYTTGEMKALTDEEFIAALERK